MEKKHCIIRLRSPVRVQQLLPYENPWDSVEEFCDLPHIRAIGCVEEVRAALARIIGQNLRNGGMMSRYRQSDTVREKVYLALPDIVLLEGNLLLLLTCHCKEQLTVSEKKTLVGWWESECISGIGQEMRLRLIPHRKYGRIRALLWWPGQNWKIMSEEGSG